MSRKTSLIILACSLVIIAALVSGAVLRAQHPAGNTGPAEQLGVMAEVYQHINDDYVVTPNLPKVADGALHGLVDSLDADSSYMNASEYKLFQQDEEHPPAGHVAAVVSKRVGYADVVDVQPGGNAANAGLVRGDFVEAIDNVGTRDMSLEEIRRRMEGAIGQSVTLSVVHLHHSDPVQVRIPFAITAPVPLQTSLQKGVGVIAVPNLYRGRTAQIAKAIANLKAQGARKFVLDLRNCGAGSYAEAEHTANLFLRQGTITYVQGPKYPRLTTAAVASDAVLATAPLDVLINAGTYGPAEVAAAALQQSGRAKLIGDESFGEGSVQKLIPVGDGSALWLTVARYYTPKGKLVQDGLTPNIQQVQYAGALPQLDFPPEGVTGPQTDLQMQKAIALLSAAPLTAAAAAGATH
ncbi:MAG: S41 family peptidase [Terriglobales bacterium]